MHILTKDQMQRLAPEQQESIASLELGRTQKRERLLEQARSYRGQNVLPSLAASLIMFAPIFTWEKYPYFTIVYIAYGLWFMIQFHAAGVNRRLDALMEVLESEKKPEKL